MGLLDKGNPRATRKSVIRAACFGAAGCFLFALIMLFVGDFEYWAWLFILPFMTAVGALAGGSVEWQVPDDEYEQEDSGSSG